MKNEIKEILYKLKDSVTNPTLAVYFMGDEEIINNIKCLEPNECKLLLDHITKLQEENERVSNLYQTYEEANDLWIKKYEDYKSRIDKAIEYIEKCINSEDIYEQFITTGETKKTIKNFKRW